jgi:hypothetical protein
MPDVHSNGNYEAYLAQLFNPLAGGAQFNPAVSGAIGGGGIGTGFGGLGAGMIPNMAAPLQNPWAAQNLPQLNALWPQLQMQNSAQSLPAIQLAQQVAARQAMQAIQSAQALQALQQLVQNLAAQQWAQQAMGSQGQFGHGMGGAFGAGQIGQGLAQFHGLGPQHMINQLLQHQVLQQLAQYLATQQPGQFRYGLAA